MYFPPSLEIRETRRIVGRKIFKKDVLNEGKIAEDTIALAAHNIDIHHGNDVGLNLKVLIGRLEFLMAVCSARI